MAPLSELKGETTAIITDIKINDEQRQRLQELGFTNGSLVEIIENKNGYIIARVRGIKYGLSPDISRSILVARKHVD